jgi:hypothetical protein
MLVVNMDKIKKAIDEGGISLLIKRGMKFTYLNYLEILCL